jgi:hypothetical protein
MLPVPVLQLPTHVPYTLPELVQSLKGFAPVLVASIPVAAPATL